MASSNNSKVHVGDNELTVGLRNLKSLRNNEIARAVTSKLIRDPKRDDLEGYSGKRSVEQSVINQISKGTVANIEDYSYIFQALPDVRTAMEIWTSLIISPKDGVTKSLMWSIDHNGTDYSSELFGEMLDALRDYFENEYDIFNILEPAVEDALFKTGSYPLVIIPESSVDDLISGKSSISSESIFKEVYDDSNVNKPKTIEVLGPPIAKNKTGLESYIDNPVYKQSDYRPSIHEGLVVTDNPDLLKLKLLLNINKRKQVNQHYLSHYGLEALADIDLNNDDDHVSKGSHRVYNDINKHEAEQDKQKEQRFDTKVKSNLVQKLYRDVAYSNQEVITIKAGEDATRLPIGHPLVLKVPSSSVIPVHVPGNPRDIIGAFIILDEYGNPLNSDTTHDLFDDSRRKAQEDIKMGKNLIQSMTFYKEGCCNFEAAGDNQSGGLLNELAKTYASLVEEDLLNRLWNGINGKNVEIAHVDEIYRIMFSRALKAMRTQIIYIPSQLITYFAFDYNALGIGKSVLEDSKIIATMRATLMWADIYAKLQNATGRRKLRITVDEDDVNPMKTIETIRTEFARIGSWKMPIINEGPIDVVNSLREHNIDTIIEGDNPMIPSTQVEVEDVQVNRPTIDETMAEDLKNLHISSLGLPPTAVDETLEQQFATSTIQSNLLLNKRVIVNQKITENNLLYDHVSKYTRNSGTLIKRLALIIKNNKDLLTDRQRNIGNAMPIIEEFLRVLKIELPKPDSMRSEDMANDISKRRELIDAVVDNVLTDEMIEMFLPESIAENHSAYKEVLKGILMSKYVSGVNHFPELYDLLDPDNPEDTIYAEIKSFIDPFVKMATNVTISADKIRKLNDSKHLQAVAPEDEYGSDSGDYGGDDDSGSDDGFGEDDFGGGFGGEDESGDDADGEDTEGNEDSGEDEFGGLNF